MPKTLNVIERDTILAALRMWQWHICELNTGRTGIDEKYLAKIATDSGGHRALKAPEIDRLCVKINQ